jgi:hypothetical protein
MVNPARRKINRSVPRSNTRFDLGIDLLRKPATAGATPGAEARREAGKR